MGEAHHLTHSERVTLIRSARQALDAAGLEEVPIIAGVGGGATREVVQYGKEAAEAGADATIAILSGYFAGSLASDRKALKAYWTEVSEKSSIPVLIYNCASRPLVGETITAAIFYCLNSPNANFLPPLPTGVFFTS